MDVEHLASEMAGNAARVAALVQRIPERQARWRPDRGTWSMLEVINHLWDEEREDFRVRIDYTLHRHGEPWPGIDPGGWVTQRRYNERNLEESVAGFLSAREASLAWLRQLGAPDWGTPYEAPWGTIRAGDVFASWVAHDLLHTRQLVELHWAYPQGQVQPSSTNYAGEW